MRPASFTTTPPSFVEPLEARWLLSGNSITELQLATGSNPEKVVTGKDGSIYVYEQGTEKLARLRPGKTTFQEVDIPTASNQHFGMTVSKQGDIFFTVQGGLGAYSPKFNRVTLIPLGTDTADVAPGPDKNIWFTEPNANKIGRLTLVGKLGHATNQVDTFDVPTATAGLASITLGPKNDLWFGEDLVGQLGQVTFTTAALTTPTITEFPLPAGVNAHPVGITSGPDGNVWFAEVFANKIGKIDENTHQVSEFTVPTANSNPFWITTGPDGALWFTERNAGKLGRITTAGNITETDVPSGAGALLTSIVRGKRKTLWFTEATVDKVGKLVLA